MSETKISGVPLIKEYVQTQNVPSTAQDIILASWKKSTLGKYNSILKRWADFCHQRGKDKFCTNADEIITFLTTMIENENIGYNTICGYRSALNTVISIPQFPDISEHPLIRRFIKGVFNIKPPEPRYTYTWDVNGVLEYFNNLCENEALDYKQLSYKLVTLLMLLAGTRVNSLTAFSCNKMSLNSYKCTFIPCKLLKHSRPNFIFKPIEYNRYSANDKLCPVLLIKEYIRRRTVLDTNTHQLIVTVNKPHGSAHRDTKNPVLTRKYLKRIVVDLPLLTILKHGNWS